MKTKILTTILFIMLGAAGTSVIAQKPTLQYMSQTDIGYDASGNIISRKFISYGKTRAAASDTIPEILEDHQVKVKIYPNPTKGDLNIEVLNAQRNETIEVSVFNMGGTLLLREKLQNTKFNLNISHYPDGIYLFRIVRNGEISTWRIIKN